MVKTKPSRTDTEGGKPTLESCEAYVKARARADYLQSQRVLAQANLMGRLDRSCLPPPESALDAKARELLEETDPDAVVRLDDLPVEAVETTRALEQRLRVLDKAVELASRDAEAAWIRASHEVVGSRRQEHVRLVGEIARCLGALCEALGNEAAWFAALRAEGLHASPGSGGTRSYQTRDTATLFKALRSLNFDAWRQRLRNSGYLK